MSDIERCDCFACHGTGEFKPAADEDRPALTCAECDGKGWLEHVSAEQLRGAVDVEAGVTAGHATYHRAVEVERKPYGEALTEAFKAAIRHATGEQ